MKYSKYGIYMSRGKGNLKVSIQYTAQAFKIITIFEISAVYYGESSIHKE